MSYETAEATRQKILDTMNAAQSSMSGPEVIAAACITKNEWNGSLKTMRAYREIEQIGKGRKSLYRARATTTISADEVRANASSHSSEAMLGKPRHVARGYVHKAGHYDVPGHVPGQPLRNQDGQGSRMPRVCVGGAE